MLAGEMSSDAPFAIRRLALDGVRNLVSATLELEPGINLIVGDNGQGKTSLLEAIYIACTTKSFRTARLREVTAHARDAFSVRATVSIGHPTLGPMERDHRVIFGARGLRATIDENAAASLAQYAVSAPVVVFHAEELTLSHGPAQARRRLLDRVALYKSPLGAVSAGRYAKALKARQELLRRGGSVAELDAYEALLAKFGAELTRARRDASEALSEPTLRAFQAIAAPELVLSVAYRAGGSEDEAEALRELASRRDRDARSSAASFGPHRDDLLLSLDGHAVDRVASQGQHRAITLALKTAESATIHETTGLWPIQLLDDVSSELDPARTEALFSSLREARGQVFITSTRGDLLRGALGAAKAKQFQVVGGMVQGA
jgi:DNA replication and repair protein RecF